MSDANVDRYVVAAFTPAEDTAAYEAARQRTHALISELAASPVVAEPVRAPRRQRARGVSVRRVVLVAAFVLLLASAAVAATMPDLVSRILGSDAPPVERMEGFREPPRQTAIPDSARRKLEFVNALALGVPADEVERRDVPLEDVRLLMDTDTRGVRIGVWGTRTRTDRACYVLVAAPSGSEFPDNGGLGTCIEYRPGWPLSESSGSVTPDRWGIVGGMVDGVVEVRVRFADGTSSRAALGQNVFAWVEGSDGRLPVAVEAVLADGTVVRREHDAAAEVSR